MEYILCSVQMDHVDSNLSTYDCEGLEFLVQQISHTELPRFTVEVLRMT